MHDPSHQPIADASSNNLIDRFCPAAVLPYARLMRLDRPIGYWLLVLPCWWGLALGGKAQGGTLYLKFGLLFLMGAILMRSAGCVLNDMIDRNIDAQVARTRDRPLASRQLNLWQATLLLIALCLGGLFILLAFNRFTIGLGIASLGLVVLYPFMKRITYWPQFFLGLVFNWGALLGWSAIFASLSWPAYLLYGGALFWTLAYDTIYAHQDTKDDQLIGVKSTARKFAQQTPYWLALFFFISLALITLSFIMVGAGFFAYLGIVAASFHALGQLRCFDMNDQLLCLKVFKSNRSFGLLLLTGLLLDNIV